MPDSLFIAVFLVLSGPFVGSFLNVVIDRVPRGESVVAPGSACRSCGTRLGPRDLIPVLSFLATAGRCRHCGAAIPAWHLYVEIAATGAAALAVVTGGGGWAMLLGAVFLWLLLALAVTDMIWMRLPDRLTVPLLAVALAMSATGAGPDPRLALALAGAALGSGTFLAIRWGYAALRGREGLGLGDVKLMAGLGAAVGPADLPLMVLIAALSALAATLLHRWPGGARALSATTALPFGAALSGAGALVWLLGRVPL